MQSKKAGITIEAKKAGITYDLTIESENRKALYHAFTNVTDRTKSILTQMGLESILFARKDADIYGMLKERYKEATTNNYDFGLEINFLEDVWNHCREKKVKLTLFHTVTRMKYSVEPFRMVRRLLKNYVGDFFAGASDYKYNSRKMF